MQKSKGSRKTGGRKPGTPNRITTVFKEALLRAFDDLGGGQHLLKWAKENPTDFYKIAARLIPHEVTGQDGGPIETHHTYRLPPATREFLANLTGK